MRDTVWSRTISPSERDSLLAADAPPSSADIVVVGAGLVGLCTALSLRRRNAGTVVVLDRGTVCGEASGANAGGLWPGHECLAAGSPQVVRRAADLHAALRSEFECDHMPSGLVVPVREDAATAAAERVRQTRQAGFRAELLARDELMRVEQQLRHDGPALHFPGDGSIHPLKLAAGVSRALRREGVRICPGQEVEDVTAEGPVVKTRTASIAAGSVVVTAGAWTPLVTRLLGWSPPIRPVRGILLATEARPARTLRTVVVGDRYYYWQLRSGHLAGGGSEEDVGFARGVSPAVARDIVRDWRDRFPGLRDARFTARWSGFRPRCADLQPVIGRIPGGGRTYVAAGHFRKGVLLAPLTGELVAEELLEGQTWTLARAMRPERFPRHAPPGRRGARA